MPVEIKLYPKIIDEIQTFPEEDQDKIDYYITERLAKHGLYLLKEGLVKKLNKKLYELKVRVRQATYRVLFTIINSVFWLLVVFKKKSKKAEKRYINLALTRAAQIN